MIDILQQKLSQSKLNIAEKKRSNLFAWRGQFSPQLVEALLEAYSPQKLIFDPFAGSGTVLLESARFGLPAFGTEINPAAAAMANVYKFVNVSAAERRVLLSEIDEQLENRIPQEYGPLFDEARPDRDFKEDLVSLLGEAESLLQRILLEALIVVIDFYKDTVTSARVYSVWKTIRTKVLGLPYSTSIVDVHIGDARCVPLNDSQVGMVITSPPYINVFNYHQKYRKSVEAMGWDVLRVARSEIGANRKYRQNRFLTVIQYCIDMHEVFIELGRICEKDAPIVIIVGRESNVRKTPFFNGEITERLAQSSGLELVLSQERVFMNKFGAQIYEDVLHFRNSSKFPEDAETPKDIARDVLASAFDRVPDESRSDLTDAMAKLATVKSSPLYQIKNDLQIG